MSCRQGSRTAGGDCTTRTEEQTNIGRFWFLTGARTYNPIVRQVAMAKEMSLVDCARLYALASMAGADAMNLMIAVFDAKYAYNFWRPFTAIRNADQTGNANTPRDPSWLPLGDTPMHRVSVRALHYLGGRVCRHPGSSRQ